MRCGYRAAGRVPLAACPIRRGNPCGTACSIHNGASPGRSPIARSTSASGRRIYRASSSRLPSWSPTLRVRSGWNTGALGQVPLCTIEADRDDITGADQTHCAHALCHAPDAPRHRRATIGQCDHYDLFTGLRWHDAVHPQLCEFWHAIECDSEAKAEPPGRIR
ncbi:hypothetical protein [Paraburkholderia sp. Cpub6]|uniref:hypothetical protein n=1 Tax=Paraburkholderia sp. Cpub6 TaxID=2723094 RepID=UPI003905F7CB